MSAPTRLGLRSRFLAASGLLVLTTVAASLWTLLVLSRLAAVAGATVHHTDEATAATSSVASALEREDDALLVILGGGNHGRSALAQARAHTDQAHRILARHLATAPRSFEADIHRRVVDYRTSVDALVAVEPSDPLAQYHGEVNPLLRLAVAAVGHAREHGFAQARAAMAHARDEVTQARRVVLAISLVALIVTILVALRLAQFVISPLREIARGADAIREGDFDTRISIESGDEMASVADAFNEMARRVGEFHRSNLGEVVRAKQTLEAMMRALPDAVLLVDASEKVVSTNPAADQLFHRMVRGTFSTYDDLRVAGITSSSLRAALEAPRTSHHVDLTTTVRIEIEGDLRRLLVRAFATAGSSETGGAVLVISDVTELARLDEMRTELVAAASHELRTPVTTLRMTLLMLREGDAHLAPRMRELVETALGGVEQIDETVRELLDMTQIEAGQLRLSLEPFDIDVLIEETIAQLESRATDSGIRMVVGARASALLLADRSRVRIVLSNVLGNALKYAPSGTDITISSAFIDDTSTYVKVCIDDSGRGVPARLRDLVFEKFFRVEHTKGDHDAMPGGVGIGLYLCKEIVDMHGGRIRCTEPPDGSGTRIEIELPTASRSLRAQEDQ